MNTFLYCRGLTEQTQPLVLCWWRGNGMNMVNGLAVKKKKGKVKSEKGVEDYS